MTPSPRPPAAQEAILSAQLVSLGARWLRFAYRAARAWFTSWRWLGRYGVVFFAVGVAEWIAGCPLWAPPLPSTLFSALGAIFCTWGAGWMFVDSWGRAGGKRAPAPKRARHE